MNKLVKLGVGAASSAIFFALFAGNTFAADLTIDGNGAGSVNTIKVKSTCTTNVTQNSNTTVGATINASSSTGGNVASGNTGNGGVSVVSGDATTIVGVSVTGGSNTATLPDCCCGSETDEDKVIKDNGAGSVNKIKSKSQKTLTIKQKSKTTLGLSLTAKSKTGKNKAKDNTGDGEVVVESGVAETTVGVEVTGGENTL